MSGSRSAPTGPRRTREAEPAARGDDDLSWKLLSMATSPEDRQLRVLPATKGSSAQAGKRRVVALGDRGQMLPYQRNRLIMSEDPESPATHRIDHASGHRRRLHPGLDRLDGHVPEVRQPVRG